MALGHALHETWRDIAKPVLVAGGVLAVGYGAGEVKSSFQRTVTNQTALGDPCYTTYARGDTSFRLQIKMPFAETPACRRYWDEAPQR